ncbi:ubiquinol-cytochrome c reductase iron-sulfur subunit [Croceitalea marina]|uniref:Ubiquinol-cytochrome c reductase iron-sulfur subunit n=1 Tax=Croceitalea marina TaxID=1775166 RepID=A0ABW5MRR3_9FLAO
MERKEFLRSLGAGAAFALTFPCLNGCSSDSEDLETFPEPTGVDFTVDLTDANSAPLANNGGFILAKSNPADRLTDIVVARNLEGNFVAASQICSHQQTDAVRFISEDGGIFRCSTHGSRFSQTGTPLNSVTNNPLKVFQTELNGDILRVFES